MFPWETDGRYTHAPLRILLTIQLSNSVACTVGSVHYNSPNVQMVFYFIQLDLAATQWNTVLLEVLVRCRNLAEGRFLEIESVNTKRPFNSN